MEFAAVVDKMSLVECLMDSFEQNCEKQVHQQIEQEQKQFVAVD